MGLTEILEQLPTLSHEERKLIVGRALQLNWNETEREAIEISEACAVQCFQMLDDLEAGDDAKNPTRRGLDH
jgi:hypothetical protein